MKNLLITGLILMLALSLVVGCSQQEEPADDTQPQQVPEETGGTTMPDTTMIDTMGGAGGMDTTGVDTTPGQY